MTRIGSLRSRACLGSLYRSVSQMLRRAIPSKHFFELPPFYVQYKDLDDNLLDFEWSEFSNALIKSLLSTALLCRNRS